MATDSQLPARTVVDREDVRRLVGWLAALGSHSYSLNDGTLSTTYYTYLLDRQAFTRLSIYKYAFSLGSSLDHRIILGPH